MEMNFFEKVLTAFVAYVLVVYVWCLACRAMERQRMITRWNLRYMGAWDKKNLEEALRDPKTEFCGGKEIRFPIVYSDEG